MHLLDALIWFLFIPVAISALVWILVSVFDKSEKSEKDEKKEVVAPTTKRDILTSIE
jgi:large-conductance mechanosensitive channel